MQYLNVIALAALATAATTSYQIETVTDNHTVDVTVTSCSGHPDCTAEAVVSTETTVTETVDGIQTIYTTVCALSEEAKAAEPTPAAPTSEAPVAEAPVSEAPSSSEEIIYIDETTTPTVTASTGIELTTTLQSTLISSYSAANDSSLAGINTFEGAGHKQTAFGVAGLALAAVLL